jgi:hypothetical protein
VAAAFGGWDQNPCDPAAANEVVGAITNWIQSTADATPSLRHVTIVGSDGVPRPIRVVDAKAQEFIRGLKVGDEVQLTFSEAVAVSVEHAR